MVSCSIALDPCAGKEGDSIFKRTNKENDPGLTGSLKDFGLADLFQLLGQQQKTGVLTLQHSKSTVQVLFDKGLIVGAEDPRMTAEESPLGIRLIRGGLLSAEDWKSAYRQHKESLISIEKVLVKNDWVRQEDLTAVLRLLTFEGIYGLFKWRGGTFQFESKKVFYDPTFVEPLKAEYLLLDVLRMVDEWPMLQERIPTFDVVFQKKDALASLDALNGTPWEKQRTFQMEVLYDLVNGERNVREIINLSFMGEFDVCKNLITMMDADLIEPLFVSKSPGSKNKIPMTKTWIDRGAYLLVGFLTLFFLYQVAIARWGRFPLSQEEWKGWLTIRNHLQKIEATKVLNAREVFLLEENRYPRDPTELVKKGLLFP